ncbi:hypothetical protein D3C85_1667920 [compost metagenome]
MRLHQLLTELEILICAGRLVLQNDSGLRHTLLHQIVLHSLCLGIFIIRLIQTAGHNKPCEFAVPV